MKECIQAPLLTTVNFGNDTPAGIGDPVSAWRDYSGNNRHALQSAGGPGGSQPVLQSTINGSGSLQFDGTNDFLEGTSLPLTGTDTSYTILAVFRTNTIASGRGMMYIQVPPAPNTIGHANHVFYRDAARLASDEYTPSFDDLLLPGLTTTKNYLGSVARDSSAVDLKWYDGTGSASAQDLTPETYTGGTPTLYQVGTYSQISGQWLNGYLAELIIYDSKLSGADLQNVNDYLVQKYFVPEPNSAGLLLVGAIGLLRRRSK